MVVSTNGEYWVPSNQHRNTISIVIPCYNDQSHLPDVISELREAIASINDCDWEIMIVDDHSEGEFPQSIIDDSDLTVKRHPVNLGYGASIKTGIRAVRGDYVLTMDADGQHDPDYIKAFLEDLGQLDLVAGNRQQSSGVPMIRRPGKFLLSRFFNYVIGQEIPDFNCGMRLMRRKKIERYMRLCSDRFSFSMSSTVAFVSERDVVKFVPVVCRSRKQIPSQVNPMTAFETLLKIIRLGVVFVPLRLFLPVALFFFVCGIVSLLYDLYILNLNETTVFCLTFGAIIFCFGLLSDQVAYLRREQK